jgi:hypothetical protein
MTTDDSPVPDLHGWLTQQIDRVEETARDATNGPWYAEPPDTTWGEDKDAELAGGGKLLATLAYERNGYLNADHIAMHNPANVLRRCAADRRILARHRLDPGAYWMDAAACEGCGSEGEMGDPVTENLNDCPELLDLGHAHGLTEEILAELDRPQDGERPEPGPGFLMSDSIAGAMYGRLFATVINARPMEPSPEEKAIRILEPELKKIPSYIPTTKDQQ